MALSVVLLVGCGSSSIPKCSDNNVQKTVLDISNTQFKNAFTAKYMGGRATYDALKDALKGESEGEAKRYLDLIDKDLASISPLSLADIRTTGQDDKVRKCGCAANIVTANKNSLPITYTVQYTEKNEIYVEVFGLN